MDVRDTDLIRAWSVSEIVPGGGEGAGEGRSISDIPCNDRH